MSRPIIVHSDGTGRGTVILDENGKELAGVTEIDIHIDAAGLAEAVINVRHASTVINGTATEVLFSCPLCYETHSHTCDSEFQHSSQLLPVLSSHRCNVKNVAYGECLREINHTQSHFDGKNAWV